MGKGKIGGYAKGGRCIGVTVEHVLNETFVCGLCRHWVIPMNKTMFVGSDTVTLMARQAVMDTGSSVITASTADANTINAVRLLLPSLEVLWMRTASYLFAEL